MFNSSEQNSSHLFEQFFNDSDSKQEFIVDNTNYLLTNSNSISNYYPYLKYSTTGTLFNKNEFTATEIFETTIGQDGCDEQSGTIIESADSPAQADYKTDSCTITSDHSCNTSTKSNRSIFNRHELAKFTSINRESLWPI